MSFIKKSERKRKAPVSAYQVICTMKGSSNEQQKIIIIQNKDTEIEDIRKHVKTGGGKIKGMNKEKQRACKPCENRERCKNEDKPNQKLKIAL